MNANWGQHRAALDEFRAALVGVTGALAPSLGDHEAFLAALAGSDGSSEDLWPDPPSRVDLAVLQSRLISFWPTYRALPDLAHHGSWRKYRDIPSPFPVLQRRVLEQASRVLLVRESELGLTQQNRLHALIFGEASPNPGMEYEWYRLWKWPLDPRDADG